MKTINLEKAAKYGYYQLSNLPAHVKADKWFSSHYMNPAQWECSFIPAHFNNSAYEVGYFGEVRAQKKNFSDEIELWHVDGFNMLLFADSLEFPLILRADSRTGKYDLYPVHIVVNLITKDINHAQRKCFTAELKEPNKIGVFSDKKLAAWVDYCAAYVTALDACRDSVLGKKNQHEKYIESVVSQLSGAKVHRHENYTWIDTALFEIKFSVLDNGEYLRKEVTFKGKIEDIINLHKSMP